MNLYKKKIPAAFIITLLATLFIPSLFPAMRLIFFAPFLVISFYQKSLVTSLCYALGCGVILDLLNADMHFGMHALSFTLTTFALYPQRKNFFPDSISTLPLMTFFFSVMTTVLDLALLYALQQPPILTWQWLGCDILLMPSFDALFGFLVFIVPAAILGRKPRAGEDYFTSKAKV